MAELAVAPAAAAVSVAGPTKGAARTVADVLLAFLRHAEGHYRRPDGTTTQEMSEYKQAFAVLNPLYGHTLAAEFGPLALKAVRAAMVKKGWSVG